MRPILPISTREFVQMMQKCSPPIGLETKIAVANSGGPDSTCLLYLMSRYVTEVANSNRTQGLSSVVSLTIDHGLQASSRTMAERCAKNAAALGVDHVTTRIPWSVSPFPALPSKGRPFEGIARDARYHILFQIMHRLGIRIIVFGHHADDQVETCLMRLGRQTTELGAGGIRRCRRWGMGSARGPGTLGWAGHEGMNRWILRPLLDVSKDRILATCKAHHLEYMNDPTNFQPEITLRNAIRYLLSDNQQGVDQTHTFSAIPANITQQLLKIEAATQSLRSVSLDVSSGREQLRAAVKLLSSRLDDIDRQVDSHLLNYGRPSFPGTFLLSTHHLAAVRDDTVRAALILRIMRYVSPHPWGSLLADGKRRQTSIQQIIHKIWNRAIPHWERRKFVAGGGVLWTPVLIGAHGRVVVQEHASITEHGENQAWLASRQPPLHPDKVLKMGLVDPLHLKLTNLLAEKIKNPNKHDKTVEVLYDCRFLLRFNLDQAPNDIIESITEPGREGSIIVRPHSRWYMPHIVWRKAAKEDTILASDILGRGARDRMGVNDHYSALDDFESEPEEQTIQRWIRIEWIRSLDAA